MRAEQRAGGSAARADAPDEPLSPFAPRKSALSFERAKGDNRTLFRGASEAACATGKRSLPVASSPLLKRRPTNPSVCHWQAQSASGVLASSQTSPRQPGPCATGKRSLPVASPLLLKRRPTNPAVCHWQAQSASGVLASSQTPPHQPVGAPLASAVCQWRPRFFSNAAPPTRGVPLASAVCQWRPRLFSNAAPPTRPVCHWQAQSASAH